MRCSAKEENDGDAKNFRLEIVNLYAGLEKLKVAAGLTEAERLH